MRLEKVKAALSSLLFRVTDSGCGSTYCSGAPSREPLDGVTAVRADKQGPASFSTIGIRNWAFFSFRRLLSAEKSPGRGDGSIFLGLWGVKTACCLKLCHVELADTTVGVILLEGATGSGLATLILKSTLLGVLGDLSVSSTRRGGGDFLPRNDDVPLTPSGVMSVSPTFEAHEPQAGDVNDFWFCFWPPFLFRLRSGVTKSRSVMSRLLWLDGVLELTGEKFSCLDLSDLGVKFADRPPLATDFGDSLNFSKNKKLNFMIDFLKINKTINVSLI